MASGTVTNDITELVYGADDSEGIVSIDVWGNTIYEYHLTNKGETVCNIVKNYQPWYIVHSDAEVANMAGDNHFNSLRRLNKFKDMQQLYDAREASGRRDEFLMIGNKASQYMVETGKTLFKGIDVDDLHILGFDIETTGLSPLDSEVKMISVVSNRGYNDVLYNQDEAVLIQQFVQLMETLDPDIVLTYNGHRFDIPFLMKRAEFKGLDLGIGRNGINPIQYKFQHRMDGENKMIDGMRIFGRHHIDMMYAVMKFDALERKLSNYKLKSVVAQYGLEKAGRVHLNFNEILEGITSEDIGKRNQTIEYCRADAEDLLKLHAHVCPAEFYQARIIPMNYYALINAGSVGRINTLMIRGYLRNMHSIPMYSTDFAPFGGGLNESKPGIYTYVGDSDLTSMYPSIQIHRGFFPQSDTVGLMRDLLIYLRDERIKMKADFKRSKDPVIKASLDGKQKALKVLLNSFFGTMASMGFYWRDNAAAAKITEEGRRLIGALRDTLRDMGFTVVSLDTDGISYTNGTEFDFTQVTAALKAVLPQGMYRADEEGIESKLLRKMIVFHSKTYAILKDDNSIQSKGSALTSTDIPPFVRQFTSNMIRLLFDRKFDDLRLYYQSVVSDITNNRLPITDFTTIKRVNKTVQQYQDSIAAFTEQGKTKAKLPLYELAIETKRQLEVGDKVSVYHADIVVEKPLTKTQAKRAAQFATMDTLFAVQSTPRTTTIQRLKWADQYDASHPDISKDYYFGRLNDKIYGLFHDPLTNENTILTLSEFDSIFGLDAGKVSIYRFQYTDFATHLPDVNTFSKWERLRKDQLRDLMRQGGTDMYTTIQQFDNQYVTAGESVYHPLYFDVDAADLGAAFDTATCIYRYFANVLKVPLQYITVWFSGSKGFHIEVDGRVFGYRPSPYLTQVNKDIANWLIKQYQLTSLDVGSIYSSRRMWRIPFSINSKSGLRKTWLPQFDQFKSITEVTQYVASNQDLVPAYEAYIDHINDIGAPAKVLQEHATWYATHHDAFVARTKLAVVQKPSWKFERLAAALPRCIDYLLRESISVAGDRNRATMTLLSFFKESGITMEEAIERVSEWTMRIPKGLTSATNHATIKQNVTSVARSIYNGGTYVFSCSFAKSLIARSGFECPTVCVLKDD